MLITCFPLLSPYFHLSLPIFVCILSSIQSREQMLTNPVIQHFSVRGSTEGAEEGKERTANMGPTMS